IYELQEWLDGSRYVTSSPDEAEWMESAATTLGLLHQTSADFEWHQHTRSEERSGAGIAQAYVELIRERAEGAELPQSVRDGLARTAEHCLERLQAAAEVLEAEPRPPELHIHGDYQPHNLAFGLPGVTAVYDFDAARWERRIDEVAYSLLFFAG